jgi:hypothetical protein
MSTGNGLIGNHISMGTHETSLPIKPLQLQLVSGLKDFMEGWCVKITLLKEKAVD